MDKSYRCEFYFSGGGIGEAMKQVGIYIIHTAKQKRVPNALFLYCMTYKNRPCRYGKGELEDTTQSGLYLAAIVDALQRMKEPCDIRIHINICDYLANMVNQGMPWEWRKNGWKNSRGKWVADWVKWEKVLELLDTGRHHLSIISEKSHAYTGHLQEKLRNGEI